MLYKFQYTTPEEREIIIQSNTFRTLIEEHNLIVGNFLIFSDDVPVVNKDILVVMDALATTFEEVLALRAIVEGGTV